MIDRIIFTTPRIYESEEFGCASYGFAGEPDHTKGVIKEWKKPLDGIVLSGTIDEVLRKTKEASKTEKWQAGIVLFGNCGRENVFIRELQRIVNCDLTGGAAAFDPIIGKTGLVFGNSEVAVLLIDEAQTKIHVETLNIHNHVLGKHEMGYSNPRIIDTIDGKDALKWYSDKRKEYGLTESDFEHLTFSDENNINAHLSLVDGKLCSGRDLTDTMLLRYVEKGTVYTQMSDFYNDPNALIFGCAGLKSILEKDILCDSMGMFMFGEVVTVNGISEFGNLMLSKLVVD